MPARGQHSSCSDNRGDVFWTLANHRHADDSAGADHAADRFARPGESTLNPNRFGIAGAIVTSE
jgi:hypothetical protein